jgi:anti-sigma28 factor (negative regulator of flagellin synthesis)
MQIKPTALSAIARAYEVAAPKKAKAADSSASSLEAKKETVELSDSSVSVQKVMDKINSLPDVRIEVVESIKQRIRQNDYPLENKLLDALDRMAKNDILNVVA